jgi:hypothetical protein
MSANFKVGFRKGNGILYIDAKGDFDGSSAWELANLIHDHYDGNSRVVINTEQMRDLYPFGCSTFKCRFRMGRVPADRLLIKGEQGSAIAPEGCRIQEGADKKAISVVGAARVAAAPRRRNLDKSGK